MNPPGKQSGGILRGLMLALLAMAGLIAVIAWLAPQQLPKPLRVHLLGEPADPRDDPNSARYSPAVYRWKDAAGRTQVTDVPPTGRPYETVRINPDTNVVPSQSANEDE